MGGWGLVPVAIDANLAIAMVMELNHMLLPANMVHDYDTHESVANRGRDVEVLFPSCRHGA